MLEPKGCHRLISVSEEGELWGHSPNPFIEEDGSVSCSVVSDSVTPWIVAHQAPLSIEFSMQEDWVGCHFLLQGSSSPKDWTWVSWSIGRFFTFYRQGYWNTKVWSAQIIEWLRGWILGGGYPLVSWIPSDSPSSISRVTQFGASTAPSSI